MKINIKSKDSVLVISVEGELTLNNRERAQRDMEQILEEGKNIIIDGASLTYVDSSGLGLFLEINNKLKQKGQMSLAFVNLNSIVRKSLEVTHLVQIMPIYNSEEEALASFSSFWRWQIPSNVIYVKAVSNRILQSLSFLNLTKNFLAEIRLCTEEAVINAIKHGNRNDTQKLVTVGYNLVSQRLEISISDEGEGFDMKTRGRGLSLIFNFMDEVRFNEKGNTILMIKNL
jgi:serine/threonine-protein kinase RsbW